jgi:hypothetical protein
MSDLDSANDMPPLTESATNFLLQECDRMLNLYTQAQANAQSVFNFYLTFVTAVIGAIVFIVQVGDVDIEGSLSLLLLFAALVGSVYLSALSGRYAHAARYAHAVDEIRRYLIIRLHIPTPTIYGSFLGVDEDPHDAPLAWYIWLFPSGTYQMFIAIVNSAALGAMTWLIFSLAETGAGRGMIATFIVFLLSLTVYNIYSRLIMQAFNKQLHVRIDMGRNLDLWAARE